MALAAALRLGGAPFRTGSQLRTRRLSQLAFASPPLFVFIGTTFFMLESSYGDYIFWAVAWILIIAVIARGSNSAVPPNAALPIRLRRLHGVSALLIVALFLAWHLLNHMSALVNLGLNQAMMEILRKWYRSVLVQPFLVGLFAFQVASGLVLFHHRTAKEGDAFRIIQTTTGIFLAAFIVSHLSAVFVLGRLYSGVDTTFRWAAGAPAGLLHNPWNVRLIPHYSMAPWVLMTHVGLGLRGVLLGRGYESEAANRIVRWFSISGLVIAVLIIVALLRVEG
jgi:hypothetical protein